VSSSLERLQQNEDDIEMHWRSYELRPAGSPPPSAETRAKIEAMRPQFRAIAKQHYDIEINAGPFGIDSRPALVGAKYAEAQSEATGEAYHKAVLHAYWQAARDISDLDVLRELAESVGLDGDDFLAALDDPQYAQAVTQDVMTAHNSGIQGVPALVFNERMLLPGAQPYETLKGVVAKIRARGDD
jgi:predicted DsbA family dithiol-disulfide isomerase